MAQHAGVQILQAVPKVDDFTGEYVHHHGVDGKIPAAARLLEGKAGIDGNVEIRVPCARSRLTARHGDVEICVFQ